MCQGFGMSAHKQFDSTRKILSQLNSLVLLYVPMFTPWPGVWKTVAIPISGCFLSSWHSQISRITESDTEQVLAWRLQSSEGHLSAAGWDSRPEGRGNWLLCPRPGLRLCKLCSQTCCFHKTKVINWSYKYELHLSIKFSIKFISMFCPIPLWSIPLHLALAMQFKKIV